MKCRSYTGYLAAIFIALSSLNGSFCQPSANLFAYGDPLPDAPELATRGDYSVGVRTLDLVHENQLNILQYGKSDDTLYSRPLKVEIWYPAQAPTGTEGMITYEEVMGNANSPDRPLIPFTFLGRATRDANAETGQAPYPLVIVSHGYTGSRYLMTYLTENLASKGYVVVAIDHTESTFKDAAGFNSTLLNRSLDVLFILNEMARLSRDESSFLNGLANADNTALIGYSMGGYGVVNVAGGGYSPRAVQLFSAMSGGSKALEKRSTGHPDYEASMDPRIKAIVAFAPWGMQRGVWDDAGLAGIKIPSLFVAGSLDDISGYEKGTKAMFTGAVNSNRFLLTYVNARHNVAPNPPPTESMDPGLHIDEYLRYADSIWDMRRINNINQHFVTAFLGIHLNNDNRYDRFFIIDENEKEWPGFRPRTSVGLELEYRPANE